MERFASKLINLALEEVRLVTDESLENPVQYLPDHRKLKLELHQVGNIHQTAKWRYGLPLYRDKGDLVIHAGAFIYRKLSIDKLLRLAREAAIKNRALSAAQMTLGPPIKAVFIDDEEVRDFFKAWDGRDSAVELVLDQDDDGTTFHVDRECPGVKISREFHELSAPEDDLVRVINALTETRTILAEQSRKRKRREELVAEWTHDEHLAKRFKADSS
jgi:hypothetical protein